MNVKNPQPELGLLLHSLPHLGGKQILKIITPTQGLLTLIGRSANRELLNPFHIAEWVYKMGNGDMGKLVEGSIEERFSFDTYPKLQAAGQIGSDLLRTQMPGKSAEAPFELARACLRALASAEQPERIAVAFRLKLLRIEGLLDPASCDFPIQALCNSRSFAEIQMLPFSEELRATAARLFDGIDEK